MRDGVGVRSIRLKVVVAGVGVVAALVGIVDASATPSRHPRADWNSTGASHKPPHPPVM